MSHTFKKFDKAVIWDMDGIIVNTGPFHFEAWHQIASEKGRTYTQEDFQHGFGRRNDTIVKHLFGELPPEEVLYLSDRKEQIFRDKVKEDVTLLPGVVGLLEILKQNGFGLALGTAAPAENVRFIMKSLGIADYFQSMVTAENVTKGKPDPEVFLLAAQKLAVSPEWCIVIEDAVAGVNAAKSAGMKCIAVTNTHPAEDLAKADLVTDNLEKINHQHIGRLLGLSE